jgi:hypothetical protein
MYQSILIVSWIVTYLATGVLIAVQSLRTWRRGVSESLLAHILFPWNACDGDVGTDIGYSICMLVEHHRMRRIAYVIALSFFWPMKLLWCLCTGFFVAFFYRH